MPRHLNSDLTWRHNALFGSNSRAIQHLNAVIGSPTATNRAKEIADKALYHMIELSDELKLKVLPKKGI